MFIHQKNNTVNINNQVRLTVEQFRALEPTYPDLPAGYTDRYYEPENRHDLTGSGKSVIRHGKSWSDGDRYIKRIADFMRLEQMIREEEERINENVEKELNKRKAYDELRKNEYPSIEEMVVAMWENLIEKRNKKESGVSDLQEQRKEVKEKYPMPEE